MAAMPTDIFDFIMWSKIDNSLKMLSKQLILFKLSQILDL